MATFRMRPGLRFRDPQLRKGPDLCAIGNRWARRGAISLESIVAVPNGRGCSSDDGDGLDVQATERTGETDRATGRELPNSSWRLH